MSVFTIPASSSVEEAKAYTTAVLELLGRRDPMEVLRATPRLLGEAIRGLSLEQLRAPESPQKWSALHVLQHLADSELVWGYRLRTVLAEDRPPLKGYDQDLWAARLRYEEADAEEAVEEFTVFRRANLRLLSRMSPDDLRRAGVHAERGEETVEDMLRLYAGHDLVHLRQLERIRGAAGEARR